MSSVSHTVPEAVALTPSPSNSSSSSSGKPLVFRSNRPVEGQGINLALGYGGWSIAFGINAAWHSLSASQHSYRLYSCLGTFIGPTSGYHHAWAEVTSLRDTRTFATRRVDIFQDNNGGTSSSSSSSGGTGQRRIVMSLVADFQRPEQGRELLRYEVPPARKFTGPEGSLSVEQVEALALERGATEAAVQEVHEWYNRLYEKMERRCAPEGWLAQSAVNVAMLEPGELEMDARPVHERGSVEWYRSLTELGPYIEHLVSVAYLLDAGIAHMCTNWNRVHEEVATAGSLEFALRCFGNDINLNRWHSREDKSTVAAAGRTFNEAYFRDEQGNMIASISEQCILRAKPSNKAKSKM